MRRKNSVRLPGYDYASPNAYFVTLCVFGKSCVLGEIHSGKMILSEIGEVANQFWLEIPKHYNQIEIDEYVLMLNHIHGIVLIKDAVNSIDFRSSRGVRSNTPTKETNFFSRISPKESSLSVVIRNYKSAVTRVCRMKGYCDFKWQRGFYDHIIRDEKELSGIRSYISDNPVKWDIDEENAENQFYDNIGRIK